MISSSANTHSHMSENGMVTGGAVIVCHMLCIRISRLCRFHRFPVRCPVAHPVISKLANTQSPWNHYDSKGFFVTPDGLEPSTLRLEVTCSIQLSYGAKPASV